MSRLGREFCVTGLAVFVAAIAGCGLEPEAFRGENVVNQPPETEIVSTPPTLSRTDAEVQFHWRGTDADGEVVGFEWRISDNGSDGVVDVLDTLETVLPWRFTTATDSVFHVQASLDSFPTDLANPNLDSRYLRYWGSHTLFVRSVDERGRRDPTPAQSSFTSTTLAPTVQIDVPRLVNAASCISAARVLTFGWTGNDPDGFRNLPESTRHLLLPVERASGNCYSAFEFQNANPIPVDDPRWSEWIPYDSADLSTRRVTFPAAQPQQMFLFAVQARDEAGAVTPTFQWNVNVRHVRIGTVDQPVLTIREPRLGTYSFIGQSQSRSFEVVPLQPLELSWTADASSYAGVITDYRYGWDVADPEDPRDPGWAVNWGIESSNTFSPPREFSAGAHQLLVMARDNSGSVVAATLFISVIPVPTRAEQRPLLMIDDFPNGNSPDEVALDFLWDTTLRSLVGGRLLRFSGSDFLNADTEVTRLTFRTLVDYRSVIWFLGPSDLSFWQSRFVRGGSPVHFADVYQQNSGNLLLIGPGAVYATAPHQGSYPLLFNRSLSQYPFRSLCLEASDVARPAPGTILGEPPGNPIRTFVCDGLHIAKVAPEFLADYPDANGQIRDLRPTSPRILQSRSWDLDYEEFYNSNVTTRNIVLFVRSCQTPMFRWRARRDEGQVVNPAQNCRPFNATQSSLDGVPLALAVRTYSEQKPLRGTEDYVWGFHPIAFNFSDVQAALLYVLGQRWELELAPP